MSWSSRGYEDVPTAFRSPGTGGEAGGLMRRCTLGWAVNSSRPPAMRCAVYTRGGRKTLVIIIARLNHQYEFYRLDLLDAGCGQAPAAACS